MIYTESEIKFKVFSKGPSKHFRSIEKMRFRFVGTKENEVSFYSFAENPFEVKSVNFEHCNFSFQRNNVTINTR